MLRFSNILCLTCPFADKIRLRDKQQAFQVKQAAWGYGLGRDYSPVESMWKIPAGIWHYPTNNVSEKNSGDGEKMQIYGKNECYICKFNLDWTAFISEGDVTSFSIMGNQVIGDFVALGETATPEGKKVECEVIVQCPRCRNRNKYMSSFVMSVSK